MPIFSMSVSDASQSFLRRRLLFADCTGSAVFMRVFTADVSTASNEKFLCGKIEYKAVSSSKI